jgi:hypothetical protein
MSERLKMLNEPRFTSAKEWLTDRYDNLEIPAPWRYRTGKRGTPPIEFGKAPRTNILATSSDAWFFGNLAESDSLGGFLPRWMLVRVEGERRDVPVPKRPDPALVVPLAARLQAIAHLSGEADLSAIMPLYEKWYIDTKTRFLCHSNTALAESYFNRHKQNVLKLAVIFEASGSATLKVSAGSWGRAVEFMSRVEESTVKLLDTGMTALGFQLKRVEDRIRQAGKDGLSQNDFTRAFQSADPRDRDGWIKTLTAAGRVNAEVVSTGGRQKTVYVHANFRQGKA